PCWCGCAVQDGGGVTADCCSRRRGTARLVVTVLRGWGWWGDHFSKPDVYVRVEFGGGGGRARTDTVWNAGRPRWDAILDLGTVELGPGKNLKVEVWDEDNRWDDDFLGSCQVEVVAGGDGRHVVCYPGGGHLELRYRVTCGPALGGEFCLDYVAQPPARDGVFYTTTDWEWPMG
ncbi:PERF protein, partial [Geococcyx californianus]|nr:PERF protein [Geococcyx californianus]